MPGKTEVEAPKVITKRGKLALKTKRIAEEESMIAHLPYSGKIPRKKKKFGGEGMIRSSGSPQKRKTVEEEEGDVRSKKPKLPPEAGSGDMRRQLTPVSLIH